MMAYTGGITVTTTSANTAIIWQGWNAGAISTSTTSASNTTVWATWTSGSSTCITANPHVRQLTEEEVRAFLEAERREKEERERAAARARHLLVTTLSASQRETYEKHKYFDVDIDGKTYRVRHGTHGNVRLLDRPGGQEIRSFCIQPSDVPTEDAMLAQKLLLESDEQEFLRIANARELPRNT